MFLDYGIVIIQLFPTLIEHVLLHDLSFMCSGHRLQHAHCSDIHEYTRFYLYMFCV